MTTPSTQELLVSKTQETERLRLLLLADECKDLEELKEKLRAMLNRQ